MPRPKLKPTEEQRRVVKAMSAVGLLQQNFANMVGIRSVKTLRKFFRKELNRGDTEGAFNVGQAMYKAALNGNVTAQLHWLARHKHCFEQTSKPAGSLPPFIVHINKESKP
jgi:hypothetical protein